MATLYVSTFGSDSNDGSTPALAFRTFGKLLGTTGIGNGDLAYIAPGVYRESITVAMTSATSETQIVGDVLGEQFGYGGEIQLTSFTTNDESLSLAGSLLNLSGRDFLTFKNITFICAIPATNNIIATTATSTDIKFLGCHFINTGTSLNINLTVGFGVSANWIIERCNFISIAGGCITITLTTGSGADYNSNISINNCFFLCRNAAAITVTSSGTSAEEGGGVTITGCTFYMSTVTTTTTRVGGNLFVFPVYVYNCLLFGSVINAGELGAIIENYNIFYAATPRTLTNVGPQSVSDQSVAPLIDMGQSLKYFGIAKPFGMPLKNSPLLGHGNRTSNITNDLLNNIRPKGEVHLLFQGTGTSATDRTLSDGSKNFGSSNNLNGYTIKILAGQGAGQTKVIEGNTNTTITGGGLWITPPNTTSKYAIYQGPTSMTSLISGSASTTSILVDSGVNWGIGFWQGHTMMVTSGVAVNQNFIITGNSLNTLTGIYPLAIAPSSGDAYELFYGGMLKGVVSTGSSYSMTDNTANWPIGTNTTGFWVNGWRVMITEGVGAGSNFAISGNSATTFSGWNSFATIPTSGAKYIVFQNTGILSGYASSGDYPAYGRDFIQTSVGCYSSINNSIKETGIVLSGANSLQLFTSCNQEFQVAVSGSTTINVYGYYSNEYSGVKPCMVIKNSSGIGVAENTGFMVGGAEQWEKISLSFTPSKAGTLTCELRNNATGVGGTTYWDAFSIV